LTDSGGNTNIVVTKTEDRNVGVLQIEPTTHVTNERMYMPTLDLTLSHKWSKY